MDKSTVEEVIEVKPIVKEQLQRPPFDTPLIALNTNVATSLRQQMEQLKIPSKSEVSQEASTEVADGTACKHGGCKAVSTRSEAHWGLSERKQSQTAMSIQTLYPVVWLLYEVKHLELSLWFYWDLDESLPKSHTQMPFFSNIVVSIVDRKNCAIWSSTASTYKWKKFKE